jgi:hypothetical protein
MVAAAAIAVVGFGVSTDTNPLLAYLLVGPLAMPGIYLIRT